MVLNGVIALLLTVLILSGGWGYMYKDEVVKLKKKYIDSQLETPKKQKNTKNLKNT